MEQEEDIKKEKPIEGGGEPAVEQEPAAEPQADGTDAAAGTAEPDAATDAEADTAADAEPGAAKAPDWKEQYARVMADFDNFRKRTARDREDLVKFAASDVIKDLLPTADTLAIALSKAENKDDPFVKGVQMAYDAFLKALADHGATPLDSVGEPFDANFHEAIAQLPSDTVEEGRISAEAKRGWLMHGKLLRAAQVVVSAGRGTKKEEAAEADGDARNAGNADGEGANS